MRVLLWLDEACLGVSWTEHAAHDFFRYDDEEESFIAFLAFFFFDLDTRVDLDLRWAGEAETEIGRRDALDLRVQHLR